MPCITKFCLKKLTLNEIDTNYSLQKDLTKNYYDAVVDG